MAHGLYQRSTARSLKTECPDARARVHRQRGAGVANRHFQRLWSCVHLHNAQYRRLEVAATCCCAK